MINGAVLAVRRCGATMKYIRRTTSAAAGNGLGTTINEHSPAMHNERRRGQWPGHHDQVPATHNEQGPHTQQLGSKLCDPPCNVAAFGVISEPHTGARPSVRLRVGTELSRCVH
jgi:hypothetical protein